LPTARLILLLVPIAALGCAADDSSSEPPPLPTGDVVPAVEVVLAGLDRPLRLDAPPGDPRLFVVEQGGLIRVFDRGGADRGVFLDLTAATLAGGERGLLGLAFAPDYATSGRFYVNYTDNGGDTRIVRYTVSAADPDRADPASAEELLLVDQPYGNHNGGMLAFGPDGMLYAGLGDGGSGGDPQNRAQDPSSLLGKLLRLDVSGATGYAVPPDNPFVGGSPRGEIWALGQRNPWVFSFVRATGDLWIADVGQGDMEEIDFAPEDDPGGRN
jgi:glucose/arabinose dehydrogenase